MDPHNALIIFVRLPKPGQVKTRLGEKLGMERACEIYDSFARHAFRLGESMRRTGVDVYVFFDPVATELEIRSWVNHSFSFAPQEGATLGERMKNAFGHTFRDGVSATVIIGTDIPDLTGETLQTAFDQLRKFDTVIGPSTDGGYYLLGMTRPGRDLFEGMQWSTGSVLSDTVARLRKLCASYGFVETLSDIDTFEDYEEYLRRVP